MAKKRKTSDAVLAEIDDSNYEAALAEMVAVRYIYTAQSQILHTMFAKSGTERQLDRQIGT